jgi:hypothetical protein
MGYTFDDMDLNLPKPEIGGCDWRPLVVHLPFGWRTVAFRPRREDFRDN